MTDRAAILRTARYNLRRALDFERRRLTEAEWRELCAWLSLTIAGEIERENFRDWAHKYLDERAAQRAEQRQAGAEEG